MTGEPTSAQQPRPIALTVKRLLDIIASLMVLLLLWWLMLGSAVLIRVMLGSPVFFVQERPGLNGRPFRLWKFRTMRDALDHEGRPLPDAERLTWLGRILRATSIDELPELWNVLIGDMSLVGPRPWLMEYLPHYTVDQMRRHHVRPGITGWAQVNGRNATSWEERLRQDVWYVDHWSIRLDLWILLRTAWTVLRREGISAAGHATMPRFDAQDKNHAKRCIRDTPATNPRGVEIPDATSESPPTNEQNPR
jgi:lipopolysaccharide/colanic/teichoic acid biosynthesis glycosyltransferase